MEGKHRKLKGLVTVLAVGLLAVPSAQAELRTDARHAALLEKGTQAQVDARHQALLGRDGRSVSSVGITSADGFDWADAGIGAAAALGLIAAGGASLVVSRKKLAQA